MAKKKIKFEVKNKKSGGFIRVVLFLIFLLLLISLLRRSFQAMGEKSGN